MVDDTFHSGSPREDLEEIWWAGVRAAQPRIFLPPLLTAYARENLAGQTDREIQVLGAGKAVAAMARVVEDFFPEQKISGFVIAPEAPREALRQITVWDGKTAGSNLPTPDVIAGTERLLALADRPTDHTIILLTGGASALLCQPVADVSLEDKIQATRLMQQRGASIHQLNCLRKHLSSVKGGWLMDKLQSRATTVYAISDVLGDDWTTIGSGPCSPDPTTYEDALAIVHELQLTSQMPPTVMHHLERGLSGRVADTPKKPSSHIQHILAATMGQSVKAATHHARQLGYTTHVREAPMVGEARQMGPRLLKEAIQRWREDPHQSHSLIAGGETTVTMNRSPGRGGRNQEASLAALQDALESLPTEVEISCLFAGTDGEDGPTDAAGGLWDQQDLSRCRGDVDAIDDALTRHDSYRYLAQRGLHLKSGPTETNVADLACIIVRPAKPGH